MRQTPHGPDDARQRDKTQKTFMDYIKLSSEELEIGEFPYESIMTSQIADELVKSANTLKFSTI